MREALDPLARTALWTASMRAREHARADRLFDEPLAGLLAGYEGPRIMRSFEGEVQRGVEDPALAVRTRFLDDRLQQAAELGGVRQFVLVAAGMDTRAFRMAWPQETVFYELDRVALLGLKQSLLDGAGAACSCERRTVGVDLTGEWMTALVDAGFRASEPTVWLVEGLLYFFTAHQRNTLLTEITRLSAAGSVLLADYVSQTSLDSAGMRAWLVKMADSGHAWQSGCDDPEGLLGRLGWSARVTEYGAPEADFGRWDAAAVEPGVPGTRGRYLVEGCLESLEV
jgi:methyltransferase (TIGR00027 family)